MQPERKPVKPLRHAIQASHDSAERLVLPPLCCIVQTQRCLHSGSVDERDGIAAILKMAETLLQLSTMTSEYYLWLSM